MGMELLERIRERAYQLWEAEGCEHGRDMEYWFRAEAQVSAEQSSPAHVQAQPQPAPEAKKTARAKAASNGSETAMSTTSKPAATKSPAARAKKA